MAKGVLSSIAASILFGVLYYLVSFLEPMTGQEVLGWRILLTSPFVTIFILLTKNWEHVQSIWQRVKAKPALMLVLLFNSSMLGFQFWLFMWAPRHGKGLEVSLGYFLLPLVLVFMGRFIYKEKLTPLKKLAVVCAALGVANEFYQTGAFAIETLIVALGMPFYFYMRRHFNLNHIGGLWYDMTLLVPASIWFVMTGALSFEALANKPQLYALILLLGTVSTTSWIFYILASRWLPFSLFGLLSYIEPVLLVLVSLILGESIAAAQWPTYILIWVAIIILAVEGVLYFLYRGIESKRARQREIQAKEESLEVDEA